MLNVTASTIGVSPNLVSEVVKAVVALAHRLNAASEAGATDEIAYGGM